GVISGPFAVTRGGSAGTNGVLTFSGDAPNAYTGLTTVNSGTLALSKTAGPAVPGDLFIAQNGAVKLLASNQIAQSASVTMAGGTFDVAAGQQTIGTLSITNGKVSGSGDLAVGSTGTFTNAQMAGSGRTIITSSAAVTVLG